MPTTSPTRLPIVAYEDRNWFYDSRLRQLRNLDNPSDYQDLNDFELVYFNDLTRGIERVIFKDEGRDSEGRSIGPAYAENRAGEIIHNYGWLTWPKAKHAADAFGVELDEV